MTKISKDIPVIFDLEIGITMNEEHRKERIRELSK